MRYFLSLEVLPRSDGVFIGQKKYALESAKAVWNNEDLS